MYDETIRAALATSDRLIAAAASTVGVELVREDDKVPLVLTYLAPKPQWGKVYLSRRGFAWRLSDEGGERFWAYDGTDDATFLRVVWQLSLWQGDPDREPAEWNRAFDGRRG